MVKDGVQFAAGRAGVALPIDRVCSSLASATAPTQVSVPQTPMASPLLRKEESKSRHLKSKKDKPVKPHRKEKKGRGEHRSRPAATAAAVETGLSSEDGAVEARARQLAEQRDDTVHSSMSKVQVVTLHM